MGNRFSLVWLIDVFVRRGYTAAGLRSHTVTVDADTTLHCWISSALLPPTSSASGPKSKRTSTKPALILIHGFGPRATWQWRSQIRTLAARFELIVPDLIFFGRSVTRSPARSEAFQAAALTGLLDVLGVARASVVGTSYGGFVAYHMSRAMGPERVDRVVIASSDLLKGAEDDKALLERAGAESIAGVLLPRTTNGLRRLLRLIMYRPPVFMPDFVLRDVLRKLFSDNLEEKLQLIKGVSIGNKKEFQLTPLPQEVLIIWGEHDQIFPLEKAFEIQKCLGENARLEVLKKTSHIPQIEDPGKFNHILLNFLLSPPKSLL